MVVTSESLNILPLFGYGLRIGPRYSQTSHWCACNKPATPKRTDQKQQSKLSML